jgi:putative transposase
MPTPSHRTAPGSSYFVTTKCWQGRSIFHVTEIAEIVTTALLHYRDRGAYLLHEFVLMPDHLHLLLTPAATTSLEKAIQFIKGGSSHQIHQMRANTMEIWQKGFYDWTIRDQDDWQTKVEYIRMNPVRAKLVQKPEDWPHSSATGNFALDPAPDKYLRLASAAKASIAPAAASELKLRPPKEVRAAHGPYPGGPMSGPKGQTPSRA